jgi:hypothetical protein
MGWGRDKSFPTSSQVRECFRKIPQVKLRVSVETTAEKI